MSPLPVNLDPALLQEYSETSCTLKVRTHSYQLQQKKYTQRKLYRFIWCSGENPGVLWPGKV